MKKLILFVVLSVPSVMAMEEGGDVRSGARKLHASADLAACKAPRGSAEKSDFYYSVLLFQTRERLCSDILVKKYAELRRARRSGSVFQIRALEKEIAEFGAQAFEYTCQMRSFLLTEEL